MRCTITAECNDNGGSKNLDNFLKNTESLVPNVLVRNVYRSKK